VYNSSFNIRTSNNNVILATWLAIKTYIIIVLMIERHIEPQILKSLDDGFVTILYGARQVGKTTLANKILSGSDKGALFKL
jgi:predicted AAA+ superfamily ATPase